MLPPVITGKSYKFFWMCSPSSSHFFAIVVVKLLSCFQLCAPMDYSMPGFPLLYYLQEFAQIHVCWVSDAIQTTHPLSPLSPPALSLSQHHGLFWWISSLHQVAKVLELQLSINPSNEHSGLISFRNDWFDLYAVQGTLKRLLQYHSSKVSIHQRSAFFMVQLSHLYMTTGKAIALTTQTFVNNCATPILSEHSATTHYRLFLMSLFSVQFRSVKSLSHVWPFVTP